MNRIILVGNGFDLAHRLPTKYEDFIRVFWKNISAQLRVCNQLILKTDLVNVGYANITTELRMTSHGLARDLFNRTATVFSSAHEIEEFIRSYGSYIRLDYNSELFRNINNNIEVYKWVDIEFEYYNLLKNSKVDKAKSLNEEFDKLRSMLIDYLQGVQDEKIDDSILHSPIKECMMAPFCAKEIAIDAREKWYDFLTRRYNYEHLKAIIQRYEDSDVSKVVAQVDNFKQEYGGQIEYNGIDSISGEKLPIGMLYPDRVMLLNFNYTNTADMYMPEDEYVFPINHIHGDLSNPNSVIFGYGDELDEKYQEIRNLNNNELLKNMKSIRYLEDVNYRNLLTFIESAPYQVYIMGHSCGVSDRTLLNTLFEHPNCVSIKPFYYVNEQGQDNYIEIVQNISRNFNDPKKMRDRVVNKTYCQPLPQCPKIEKP